MPEPKTTRTNASVTAFLDAIEEPTRRADAKAIAKLMKEVSGEKPYMLGASIVGFGTCASSTGEWPLVGFSPRKTSLVLYVAAGLAEVAELVPTLGKHKAGKGCLYVNKLVDVDVAVLREIVRRAVVAKRAAAT